MIGYLFAVLGMICFGIGGLLQKLADRKGCSALAFTVAMFGFSSIIMGLEVGFLKHAEFIPPKGILCVAIPFGFSAAAAIWVFQYGIHFGKIATSIIVINLSAAVPTVLSVLIYREPIGPKKLFILLLIAVALILLWKDMTEEDVGNQGRS
jgi:drug/metabolite transporter (DMT)-like permease